MYGEYQYFVKGSKYACLTSPTLLELQKHIIDGDATTYPLINSVTEQQEAGG